jgi:undecaprenyl-diphosphatase
MNGFDVRILLFLNQFANHWPWLDWVVTRVYSSNLLGGGVIMTLAWYALFDRNEEDALRKDHELVFGAILLCGASTIAARGMALMLPFRTRPIWTPALHFQLPQGAHMTLLGWSSFPSDHAALFFTVATGVLFVSRPLGALTMAWVVAFVSFPAVYLGIHWPTDVIAGALLGVGFAWVARIPAVREGLRALMSWAYREQTGLFFAALFLWSFEVATLFDDGRRILRAIGRLL